LLSSCLTWLCAVDKPRASARRYSGAAELFTNSAERHRSQRNIANVAANHPMGVNAGMVRVATLFAGPEPGFPGVPVAIAIARQVSISGM
jgi:hypothetical protein